MKATERDLWTLLPVVGLLGFAGWVALMVETGGVAAAIVFVTAFLWVAWRACQKHHEIRRAIAERRELLQRSEWTSE